MNEYDRIVMALNDIAGFGLLALVVGGLILGLVVAAYFVQHLVPPRGEREFRNLHRNGRGRAAQARGK